MAITGHQKAQLTARAGVLRAGTGRAGAVGDTNQVYSAAGTTHLAGEFLYKEAPAGEDHADAPSPTFTSVAR